MAGVRVEGLRQVVTALVLLGVDVEDLKDTFATIAREGAQRAAALAPKKSGRLAGDVRGNRARSKAVITAGRSAVPYAGPINYGWPARNIAASGFLQRADTELQPRAVQLLNEGINQAVRKRGL